MAMWPERRARSLHAALLCVTLIGALGGGCTGTSPESETQAVADAPSVVLPAALLAQSWPLQMNAEALAPYLGNPGWAALVTRGDVRAAVEQLGPLGGLPAARAHAEAAMMYRQAARLTAVASLQTYGMSPQDTDPLGVSHLVVVGQSLAGDRAGARATMMNVEGLTPEALAWSAPWQAWLAGDAAWPPDLSALPVGLPSVAPGVWPEIARDSHYALPERVVGEERLLEVTDPGILVAAALWHDAAAAAAAPDDIAAIHTLTRRYGFGAEPAPEPATIPMAFLFGSDLMVPDDAAFLADLVGPSGAAAVSAHASTSYLAALALACAGENGTINADLAQDASGETRSAIIAGLREAAGGNSESHHRVFADIVSVGVLRALAMVADAQGDHETAGVLLINAMERSADTWTADAKALLYLSAWDANNRYPVRGNELLHNLIRRFPSLEAARFGLEALTLRESRARGPQNPGQ